MLRFEAALACVEYVGSSFLFLSRLFRLMLTWLDLRSVGQVGGCCHCQIGVLRFSAPRCSPFLVFFVRSGFPHKIIMSAWLLTNTLASATFAVKASLVGVWTLQAGNPATTWLPVPALRHKICSKSCKAFFDPDYCMPMMSFFLHSMHSGSLSYSPFALGS